MSNRRGCRGYIASRPIRGQLWPQAVQNLVIRDYAQRNGMTYLLSAVEYAMPGCYMNLETVLEELDRIEGVLLFSLFMLPERPARRQAIYDRVLSAGASLHAALENLSICAEADIRRVEDIFAAARLSELASGAFSSSKEVSDAVFQSRFPPYLAA